MVRVSRSRRLALSISLSAALLFAATRQPLAEANEPAADPVIAAVGDMACDQSDSQFKNGFGTSSSCAQLRTSDAVLADVSVEALLGLGDYQYYCDDPADFAVSYTPSWGRLNSKVDPVAGNHEYITGKDPYGAACPSSNSTAQTYFNYFGAASRPETVGHFSFDLGTWHLIGLNAQCTKSGTGGCSATSAQTTWLRDDLTANIQPCVLAFWHQPLFTGTPQSKATSYLPWWNALYGAGADVVLNGHRHNYQRFAALNPSGSADPSGITQYVVGTGGEPLAGVAKSAKPKPLVWAKSWGYLRLTLQAQGWASEFVSSSGAVLDTSGGTCH